MDRDPWDDEDSFFRSSMREIFGYDELECLNPALYEQYRLGHDDGNEDDDYESAPSGDSSHKVVRLSASDAA